MIFAFSSQQISRKDFGVRFPHTFRFLEVYHLHNIHESLDCRSRFRNNFWCFRNHRPSDKGIYEGTPHSRSLSAFYGLKMTNFILNQNNGLKIY